MIHLRLFLRNTIIYGFAAVLPKAVNILLIRLHTQSLENAVQFNTTSEFFVWAAYFNVLLTFGMETTFFKFFNSEKNKDQVLYTCFSFILVLCSVILIPLFLFSNVLAPLLNFNQTSHFEILIGILFFDTLMVIPFAYLRIQNRTVLYTTFKILNTLVYAFLNVLFLRILPFSDISIPDWIESLSKTGCIFLSNLVASSFIFLIAFPIFLKIRLNIDFTLFKRMIFYSYPILISGLAYVTNENLDKLILPKFLDKNTAGSYAATYKLGVFVSLFTMAFRLGAEPFFFNIAGEKDAKKIYALILKWFTISGSLIVLIVVFYIDFFSEFLLKKPEYFETLSIVPTILISNLIFGIYNNISIWYKNTNKTKYAMYFSILGASFTILGLLIFVPIFGYSVAAWVTFFSYGLMTVTSYFFAQRYYKIQYDIKKIVILLSSTIILSFLSFLFFKKNHLVNSFFLIDFLILIILMEYKSIRQFLRKF